MIWLEIFPVLRFWMLTSPWNGLAFKVCNNILFLILTQKCFFCPLTTYSWLHSFYRCIILEYQLKIWHELVNFPDFHSINAHVACNLIEQNVQFTCTSAWVFCKFTAYFQNTFSQKYLWKAASVPLSWALRNSELYWGKRMIWLSWVLILWRETVKNGIGVLKLLKRHRRFLRRNGQNSRKHIGLWI